MRAAACKGREHDIHGLGRRNLLGIVQHLTHVIGVADGNVAFPRRNRLDLIAVAAVRLARQIGLQTLGPGRCSRLVIMGNHRAQKRHVVIMQTRTRADAAFPLFCGQIFIGRHFTGLHPLFRGIDNARARGQAEPLVRGIAQRVRDIGFQHIRLHRLDHAGIHHLHQPRDIDRQHQIGGRAVALGYQPLGHPFVNKGHIHGNAGLGGKGIDQRLQQFGLAVGIDIHLLRQCGQGGGQKGKSQKRRSHH